MTDRLPLASLFARATGDLRTFFSPIILHATLNRSWQVQTRVLRRSGAVPWAEGGDVRFETRQRVMTGIDAVFFGLMALLLRDIWRFVSRWSITFQCHRRLSRVRSQRNAIHPIRSSSIIISFPSRLIVPTYVLISIIPSQLATAHAPPPPADDPRLSRDNRRWKDGRPTGGRRGRRRPRMGRQGTRGAARTVEGGGGVGG